MTHEVSVSFGPAGEFAMLPKSIPAVEEARRWLDEQFVELGAEPVRMSGKVLIADKVLAVAVAAGPKLFGSDAGWAERFAACACAALGRDVVRIDADALAVTY